MWTNGPVTLRTKDGVPQQRECSANTGFICLCQETFQICLLVELGQENLRVLKHLFGSAAKLEDY